MDPKNTTKATVILKIADHIIETYEPHMRPCLLMWREIINGFNATHSVDLPAWSRDDKSVHQHWKKYGPGVVCILRDRYRMIVIRVSREIRGHLKHGAAPDRNDRVKTDVWYKSCLPSSSNPTFGIVLFPRDTCQDHPLIQNSHDRRMTWASTSFVGASKDIDRSNDLGALSDSAREEIRSRMLVAVRPAFEDPHPLFPRKQIASLPKENEEQ